jgi:S-adenosylhomocysteine hydrolase
MNSTERIAQSLRGFEVKLTKLTKKQADYLGVPVEGP